MKKIRNGLVGILMITLLVSGCSNKSVKIEGSPKDILLQSLSKYQAYQSYEIKKKREFNTIAIKDDQVVVTPMRNYNETIKETKLGDTVYFMSEITKDNEDDILTGLLDYMLAIKKPHAGRFIELNSENNGKAMLLNYEQESCDDPKYFDELTIGTTYLADYFIYLDYHKEFFDLTLEVKGGNIVIHAACNDVQGYTAKDIQETTERYPDFDPLILWEGSKVSKNELMMKDITFTLDADYNLIKVKDITKRDYGDGLITTNTSESVIQKVNETELKEAKIEALFNDIEANRLKAGNNEGDTLIKGDVVDWDFY